MLSASSVLWTLSYHMTCEPVICRCLLYADELIDVFMGNGKICNKYGNVRRRSTKFSRPGICAPLLYRSRPRWAAKPMGSSSDPIHWIWGLCYFASTFVLLFTVDFYFLFGIMPYFSTLFLIQTRWDGMGLNQWRILYCGCRLSELYADGRISKIHTVRVFTTLKCGGAHL